MPKKKIGLKNTLSTKKVVKEETSLPTKKPLPKVDKDVTSLKDKIDTHHPDEKKTTTPPKPKAKPVAKKKEEIKRFTLDLSKSTHKKLKMKCLREEITMKEYIVRLIEDSL